MHLQKASADVPPGLAELLRELGDGETGFGGTSFGRGTETLDEFLLLPRRRGRGDGPRGSSLRLFSG